MRCGYCFYFDEIGKREVPVREMMRLETLEAVVRKALEHADEYCTFGFQGGEPTLAGLGFFRSLIGFVARFNHKNLRVNYAIQTNGLLIDTDWTRFFRENDFLVGLSLDGTRGIHDSLRRGGSGDGTYGSVIKAARLLECERVQYNILTVVTAKSARHVQKIYRFFLKNGFVWQQYIPCLDPLGEVRGGNPYSLTPELYADFLIKLFDVWYSDMMAGRFIYIRYFENLAGMLLGSPPESCGLSGRCTVQHVIESDGSVYPCDFYMLDEYRLGNLATDSFVDLRRREEEIGFIAASLKVEESCRRCEWSAICRGGCRRDRQRVGLGEIGPNYYCPAFKAFFPHAMPKLADLLRARRRQGL